MNRKHLKWVLLAAAVLIGGFLGYRYWQARQSGLPEGIYSGNGRLEATLVDVAAQEPLRVQEIRVDEGDLVQPDQVLVQLDTSTLNAELQTAQANVLAKREAVAVIEAAIVKRRSDIELANIELDRARNLLADQAASQREVDVRQATVRSTAAALEEEQARLQAAQEEVDVAQSQVATIQTRIDDATLTSPVRGRVLYRLAEEGEVLGAGGKALTLVNLEDIYMEIFLPAEQAARSKIGSEARITLDFAPGLAAPGYVSFVSPEAQFTPKQVETLSEREKLMFRVKIQVPEELVVPYIENVKTGVRGVGYVKADPSAVWPDRLQNLLTPPEQPATPSAATAPVAQRPGDTVQPQAAPPQPQVQPPTQPQHQPGDEATQGSVAPSGRGD